MPRESRSRVTVLLPAPDTLHEFLLLDAVITELIEIAGGVTVSSIVPSVFDGWWRDTAATTVADANVLIVADVGVATDDPSLLLYLDALKVRCQEDFQQDIVWVTVHQVDRITTGDFLK